MSDIFYFLVQRGSQGKCGRVPPSACFFSESNVPSRLALFVTRVGGQGHKSFSESNHSSGRGTEDGMGVCGPLPAADVVVGTLFSCVRSPHLHKIQIIFLIDLLANLVITHVRDAAATTYSTAKLLPLSQGCKGVLIMLC